MTGIPNCRKMRWIRITLFVLDGIIVPQLISANSFGVALFFAALPLSLWFVLAIHEVLHALVFCILGFRVKELRIGLFSIRFEKPRIKLCVENAGFFRGFCIVDNAVRKPKWKRIVPLLAGGLSGILIATVSFVIIVRKTVPSEWNILLISFIISGCYTFAVSLLNPNGTDRLLIERIVIEKI